MDDQRLGPPQHFGRDAGEIGEEVVLRQQGDVVHFPAKVFRVCAENRITRRRHQRNIARIDEAIGQNG